MRSSVREEGAAAHGGWWRLLIREATACVARVSAGWLLTSFLVQLLQNLTNDLPDALQRLEVILRLVVLLLQGFDVVAHCQRRRRTSERESWERCKFA